MPFSTGSGQFYGILVDDHVLSGRNVSVYSADCLCDSWYVKKDRVCLVDEYENLDFVGNVRSNSVIYDTAPEPSGKKGKPTVHGRKLSIWDDFILSDEKIGDYFTAARRMLTNIFGQRKVMAYVIAPKKDSGS